MIKREAHVLSRIFCTLAVEMAFKTIRVASKNRYTIDFKRQQIIRPIAMRINGRKAF